MTNIGYKSIFRAKNLLLFILTLLISASAGHVKENSIPYTIEKQINTQPLSLNQSTTFPQIHTNLNGMVREFVRTMFQDKKGNYWFGTNGDGIIKEYRYRYSQMRQSVILSFSPL